jgi:hypothetical protein
MGRDGFNLASLKRMERRVLKQNAQTFLVRLSTVVHGPSS